MDTGIYTIYIMKIHEIYWIILDAQQLQVSPDAQFLQTYSHIQRNYWDFNNIRSCWLHLVVEIVAYLGQEDDRESGSEASEETDDENDVTVPQM